MNVLVACEESQRVCIAFRNRGHNAFSCDIQEPSGGHPEWHIQTDVLRIINGFDIFQTLDGKYHNDVIQSHWDLIIAHPPCTYLSNAGACRLYPHRGVVDAERYNLGLGAKEFFMRVYNAECEKICIENPMPSKIYNMPPPTQVVQPYHFGEPFSKKTYLWLKGLPCILPTEVLWKHQPYISSGTSKNKGKPEKSGVSRKGGSDIVRSKTFVGIAEAMAEQWGDGKYHFVFGGEIYGTL